MSKKKKKKKQHDYDASDNVSQKMLDIADSLDDYVDAIMSMVIPVGKNKKKMEKSAKIVRDAAKKIRKGKGYEVYSDDFEEYIDDEL